MDHGYSKTPLIKKLGIKSNNSILLHAEPKNYFELLGDLPDNIHVKKTITKNCADFIHLFFIAEDTLVKTTPIYKEALATNGMIWISWPKGTSEIKTDLNRELVRDHLLAMGLVDIKVAAIDQNWSGLKFVYRVKDRN